MANIFKLKRRPTGGAAGAPAALKSGEPAFNEVDNILYLGKGDDGGGNATTVVPVAGIGAFADLSSVQTIAGVKTFTSSPIIPTPAPSDNSTKAATTAYVQNELTSFGAGDMAKSVYDPTGKQADAFSQDNMVDGTTNKNYSATDKTKLAGIEVAADVTDLANVSSALNSTAKASPVDADRVFGGNSAASNVGVYTTWAQVKAFFKTYFDTLYATVAHTHTFASLTAKPTTLLGYGITDAQLSSAKGQANGYASLDGGGKVPNSQLPDSVLGAMSYQGVWNASTNSPTIPTAAAGNKGWYYVVSVSGTTTVSSNSDWNVGDWIVSNGTTWDKVDSTDQVSSVAGRQGAIVLTTADLTDAKDMATQASNAVAITGGTINGVTLDGGTF